jgi:hypothetical protein
MFCVPAPDQPATAERDATGFLLLSRLLARPLAAVERFLFGAAATLLNG